jgi:hypothetical protein
MAQLPPKKRKRRRLQLREAQRRRRARLKEQSKTFLQVILGPETLRALRSYSATLQLPVHVCAAELIQTALFKDDGPAGGDNMLRPGQGNGTPAAEAHGQLDLFVQ